LLYYRIKAVIENPRAFVRTGEFFGPDRRRRAMETDTIDRRGEEHQYPGKTRGGGR
ncbi:MAG: response regulator, partial [Rhodospirillales bacterium]|nr:response regulator [Rhodospirillales bacterium]